ncbi:MAG: DEAD/DEAH box helicase [Desulfobacterales bacterium]|nr:DEAD/DEAH box helicase [Desulfobacterales bacterium]
MNISTPTSSTCRSTRWKKFSAISDRTATSRKSKRWAEPPGTRSRKGSRSPCRDVAEELVAIYAAREAMERKSFAPPDRVYEEFCATFEFEETPDQARAIEDIHADMDDAKPMDRLICGDAGFGKTEVALRAAFRAVMDGKQAALLAPTTILAEQHYRDFFATPGRFPHPRRSAQPFQERRRDQEDPGGSSSGKSGHRRRHAPPAAKGRGIQRPGAGDDRRRTAFRRDA